MFFLAVFCSLCLIPFSSSFLLDPSSKDSICRGTALIQKGILDYYFQNNATFQEPYYWWEGGLAFNNMIENACLCENSTLIPLITDALLMKSGDNFNFMPEDQIMVEANDDLAIWGFTLLTAAERNISLPENGTLGYNSIPSWIEMAENVYLSMYERWQNKSLSSDCGGGLRWQIFPWNKGYDYKNTVSNGGMFQMAARLGRFLNNSTYLKQADEIFSWLEKDVKFVALDGKNTSVYDGAHISTNCTDFSTDQWSYNFAILLGGSAYMYNATNSSKWLNTTESLWNGTKAKFFNDDGIMYEEECQAKKTCNNDQRAFKGVLSLMLEYTSILVPQLHEDIHERLLPSAMAAAGSCDAGFDEHTCGMNWFNSTNDGFFGLGEQISSLSVIQSLLGQNQQNLIKSTADTKYLKMKLQHNKRFSINQNCDESEGRSPKLSETYKNHSKKTILHDSQQNTLQDIMTLLIEIKQQFNFEKIKRQKLELKVNKLEGEIAKNNLNSKL